MNIRTKDGKVPEFKPGVGDVLYSFKRKYHYFVVLDIIQRTINLICNIDVYKCAEFDLCNKTVKYTEIDENSEISDSWEKTTQELIISNF